MAVVLAHFLNAQAPTSATERIISDLVLFAHVERALRIAIYKIIKLFNMSFIIILFSRRGFLLERFRRRDIDGFLYRHQNGKVNTA